MLKKHYEIAVEPYKIKKKKIESESKEKEK
jgi:hypothetical protein